MNRTRFDFITDVDEETQSNLLRTSLTEDKLNSLSINPGALRYNGDEYLVVTDIIRQKVGKHLRYNRKISDYLVRVHCLSDVDGYTRGFNVTIPCDSEVQYKKYRDLKWLIRNNEQIKVTFQNLKVSSCATSRALYFTADDYKVFDPEAARGFIEI